MAKYDIEFDYFRSYESEQFAFYRIPKILFTDDYFKDLSSDAKVLYGLMLDRMSLSVKNNWIDEEDRVYIIFTLEQVMQYMNCGKDKGVKILAELDTVKGIGLIERVKRGLGKPAIIYVKSFLLRDRQECPPSFDMQEDEKTDIRCSEGEVAEVQTSEKPKSAVLKNRSAEVGKTASNNTDIIKNNMIKIDPINLSREQREKKGSKIDVMNAIQAYTDIVKNNIDYNILIQACNPGEREYIDEIVELLVETISIHRDTIMIGGVEYPYQFVKSRLLKMNYSHIQYVLECLHSTVTKIRNIKAYLLTCLFNAPSTIDSYYRAEVNYGLNKGMAE